MTPLLAALFFFVALVYSTVGFAGGSSYLALLQIHGTPSHLLPLISLGCNLIVSAQGFAQFARAGHFPLRRSLPFVALSVPAAYLGGLYPIREKTFFFLLALSLSAAGILLLVPLKPGKPVDTPLRRLMGRFGPLLGAPLGLLSGIVGIGGGIFLAPILHLARWAPEREIAALAACFIFTNSISGLAGQLQKQGWHPAGLESYWLLPFAVLAGGLIGARSGALLLPAVRIRQITGLLVILVAFNLWMKILRGA
jgi:uncharacterized membrane protein YfcA